MPKVYCNKSFCYYNKHLECTASHIEMYDFKCTSYKYKDIIIDSEIEINMRDMNE